MRLRAAHTKGSCSRSSCTSPNKKVLPLHSACSIVPSTTPRSLRCRAACRRWPLTMWLAASAVQPLGLTRPAYDCLLARIVSGKVKLYVVCCTVSYVLYVPVGFWYLCSCCMSFVACADGLLKVGLMITSANCDTKTRAPRVMQCNAYAPLYKPQRHTPQRCSVLVCMHWYDTAAVAVHCMHCCVPLQVVDLVGRACDCIKSSGGFSVCRFLISADEVDEAVD